MIVQRTWTSHEMFPSAHQCCCSLLWIRQSDLRKLVRLRRIISIHKEEKRPLPTTWTFWDLTLRLPIMCQWKLVIYHHNQSCLLRKDTQRGEKVRTVVSAILCSPPDSLGAEEQKRQKLFVLSSGCTMNSSAYSTEAHNIFRADMKERYF